MYKWTIKVCYSAGVRYLNEIQSHIFLPAAIFHKYFSYSISVRFRATIYSVVLVSQSVFKFFYFCMYFSAAVQDSSGFFWFLPTFPKTILSRLVCLNCPQVWLCVFLVCSSGIPSKCVFSAQLAACVSYKSLFTTVVNRRALQNILNPDKQQQQKTDEDQVWDRNMSVGKSFWFYCIFPIFYLRGILLN